MSDALTNIATDVGAQYGMTATDVLAYLATGDRQHANAPPGECGAVDPRDEAKWCRRPAGHGRDWHCCYRLDEDWPSPGGRVGLVHGE